MLASGNLDKNALTSFVFSTFSCSFMLEMGNGKGLLLVKMAENNTINAMPSARALVTGNSIASGLSILQPDIRTADRERQFISLPHAMVQYDRRRNIDNTCLFMGDLGPDSRAGRSSGMAE